MLTFEAFKKNRRKTKGPWKSYDHRKVPVGHKWCACESCARFWYEGYRNATKHQCRPALPKKSNHWGHCKKGKCNCQRFNPNTEKSEQTLHWPYLMVDSL